MEAHASKVRQAFLPVDVPMYDRHSCLSPSQSTTGIPACRLSPPTFATPDSNTPLQISRRHLPHWHLNGAIYWVCFRLADAIPQDKLRAWKEELALWRQANPEPWDDRQWQEYDRRFGERYHAWLDAGMGSRALARPDVRKPVADCLLRFDGDRLLIHAAVIMPTHVHALMEPLPVAGREGTGRNACPTLEEPTGKNACHTLENACPTLCCHDLSDLLHGIKGASARAANRILGTTGTSFWMDEAYDHIVRNEKQYRHFLRYINENPLKAHLRNGEFWLYLPDAAR